MSQRERERTDKQREQYFKKNSDDPKYSILKIIPQLEKDKRSKFTDLEK